MNSLRECILSIVERIKSIPANPGDTYSSYLFKQVAIWNDQIDRMENGSGYSFLSPAAFVEINTSDHEFLGFSYTAFDIDVKIHILNEMLDYCDGTLDQDLLVFDLRNSIKTYLNMFRPTQSGNLMYVDEKQEFEHNNIYHYIISFKARMIDKYGNTEPVSLTGTWSYEFNIDWEGPNGITPSSVTLCEIPSNLQAVQETQTYTYSVVSIQDFTGNLQPISYFVQYTDPDPNDPELPIRPEVGDIISLTFDGTQSHYNGTQAVSYIKRFESGLTRIDTNFVGLSGSFGSFSGTMSMSYILPNVKISWLPPSVNSSYEYSLRFGINNFLIDSGCIESISGSYSFVNIPTPRDYIFQVRNFCGGNDYTSYVSLTFSTIV